MLTRAEFEVLAAWLGTDPLPAAPFMAAPWLGVGDRERYILTLRTALRAGPSAGTPWQKAVTELRWLAAYYGTPEARAAAHASELHVPPKAM